jgi:hypothetical protein
MNPPAPVEARRLGSLELADRSAAAQTVDLAAVAERLMREFEGQVSLNRVTRVVLDCTRDVTAVRVEALPELVERCARQRLTDRLRGTAAT